MEYTQIEYDKDAEIVPFIGIQRKWANATLKLYSFVFVGYTIWITYQEFGDAAKPLKAKLTFLVPHLGAFSVFEAITVIAFIQLWDVIMYLTNRFKAKVERIKAESRAEGRSEGIAEGRSEGIAKGRSEGIAEGRSEGIAKGRSEGIAEGRSEGIAKGRSEANQVFSDWYQRLESAKARGVPFDEPPPFLNGDNTEE